MVERLLPDAVVCVETTKDAEQAVLFPEEERLLGQAVDKRRREFATGRVCARAALAKLGIPAQAIVRGERGEPCWPAGVVGSITHCIGYCACAVARGREVLALGIDAEPHAPLPDRLLGVIARPEEIAALERLERDSPAVHWDRLLFSAKESVYKAWFPLARRWLGFEDVVLLLDPSAGVFDARLLVPGPVLDGTPLRGFSGRWAVRDGFLLTAIALEARAGAPG
ncbi:MAG: 4'-phosphopantetheinyl transferase family protein [Solirubrobacteraceae bacterium]